MKCLVETVQANQTVYLRIMFYLNVNTIEYSFIDYHSYKQIVWNPHVQVTVMDPHLDPVAQHATLNFVFKQSQNVLSTKPVPVTIYLLGILLGLLIIAAIVAILYKVC